MVDIFYFGISSGIIRHIVVVVFMAFEMAFVLLTL